MLAKHINNVFLDGTKIIPVRLFLLYAEMKHSTEHVKQMNGYKGIFMCL